MKISFNCFIYLFFRYLNCLIVMSLLYVCLLGTEKASYDKAVNTLSHQTLNAFGRSCYGFSSFIDWYLAVYRNDPGIRIDARIASSDNCELHFCVLKKYCNPCTAKEIDRAEARGDAHRLYQTGLHIERLANPEKRQLRRGELRGTDELALVRHGNIDADNFMDEIIGDDNDKDNDDNFMSTTQVVRVKPHNKARHFKSLHTLDELTMLSAAKAGLFAPQTNVKK